MFSLPYVDFELGRYIIQKVKTRNREMNLKNTLCITLSYSMGDLTPQLFYQNYLPISPSFGVKKSFMINLVSTRQLV